MLEKYLVLPKYMTREEYLTAVTNIITQYILAITSFSPHVECFPLNPNRVPDLSARDLIVSIIHTYT